VTEGAAPPPGIRRAADALLALTALGIPLSTTGMEAGAIGLGVLAAVAAMRGWGVVRRTPLDAVLAVFYATLLLSTLASGRPLEAVGWSHAWVVLAYFAVFWWLRDVGHAARLARLVVLAGLVAAAYGIVQHFTGADVYRTLLGRETFVRPREAGTSGFAVIGFFRNYLTFAHTMIFPLAWAVAFGTGGARLGLVAAPVIVAAILLSTARGAWLAMLAVAGGLALCARGARVVGGVAALAMAACLTIALTPQLRAEAADMFARGGVNTGRLGIYAANLDIIHDHPVLGLGFGRYQVAAGPYYDLHPDADRRSHAHNNFLQIAAEAGLLGLAAFGLLYATVLRHGWEAIRDAPNAEARHAAAGAWAGVLGFLVGGLTQYTFGDAEVAIAMWTALAVLMRCHEARRGG
jgi:O-antigen ligase